MFKSMLLHKYQTYADIPFDVDSDEIADDSDENEEDGHELINISNEQMESILEMGNSESIDEHLACPMDDLNSNIVEKMEDHRKKYRGQRKYISDTVELYRELAKNM